uniref:Uncharacterized protein n=1 Tax=Arundo donax TaxID=35708 RepID=A0A0A9GGQ1_ARUDO
MMPSVALLRFHMPDSMCTNACRAIWVVWFIVQIIAREIMLTDNEREN